MTLTSTLPRNPRKRPAPSDEAASAASGAAGERTHTSVDAMIDSFSSTIRAATPAQQPLEWMRAATVTGAPQFLSIFDGENGSINKISKSFSLTGLPPADLIGKYPIDL